MHCICQTLRSHSHGNKCKMYILMRSVVLLPRKIKVLVDSDVLQTTMKLTLTCMEVHVSPTPTRQGVEAWPVKALKIC